MSRVIDGIVLEVGQEAVVLTADEPLTAVSTAAVGARWLEEHA